MAWTTSWLISCWKIRWQSCHREDCVRSTDVPTKGSDCHDRRTKTGHRNVPCAHDVHYQESALCPMSTTKERRQAALIAGVAATFHGRPRRKRIKVNPWKPEESFLQPIVAESSTRPSAASTPSGRLKYCTHFLEDPTCDVWWGYWGNMPQKLEDKKETG